MSLQTCSSGHNEIAFTVETGEPTVCPLCLMKSEFSVAIEGYKQSMVELNAIIKSVQRDLETSRKEVTRIISGRRDGEI
jgi:hypothetical protein